jgi:hypothetical protein
LFWLDQGTVRVLLRKKDLGVSQLTSDNASVCNGDEVKECAMYNKECAMYNKEVRDV